LAQLTWADVQLEAGAGVLPAEGRSGADAPADPDSLAALRRYAPICAERLGVLSGPLLWASKKSGSLPRGMSERASMTGARLGPAASSRTSWTPKQRPAETPAARADGR